MAVDRYRPSARRKQKGSSVPQEPNLVPIMNLFLTIIPFLMLMIVISQISLIAMNFSSGTGGGSGAGGGGDEKKLIEIHLMAKEHPSGLFPGMEIREPDGTIRKLPVVNGMFDYTSLNSLLVDLKAGHPDTNEIKLVVHPEVLYDTLIRSIDLCKANGFTSVHYANPRNKYFY